MNRFGNSVVSGGVIALFITCFSFAFSVFAAIFNHEDVGAAAGQSLLVGLFLWFICSYGFYELHGWIEERNKPRNIDDAMDGPHGVQNFDEIRSIDQPAPGKHKSDDV